MIEPLMTKQHKIRGLSQGDRKRLKRYSDEHLINELQRRKPEWTPLERVDLPTITGNTGYAGADECWVNSRYQVLIYNADHPTKRGDWNDEDKEKEYPRFIKLSIKNHDKTISAHDWRDMMRIKNELVHRDAEAFELYPAMNRICDEANQYHLWVLLPEEEGGDWPKIPTGWRRRLLSDPNEAKRLNANQRQFEKGFLNEEDIEDMRNLAKLTKKLEFSQK